MNYILNAMKKLKFFWKQSNNINNVKAMDTQRIATKEIDNIYIISKIECGLSDQIHNRYHSNILIGELLAKGTSILQWHMQIL